MDDADLLEIDLTSGDGAALLSAVKAKHGAAIADAARIAHRLFLLRSPWAPGLRFVGGQAHPARVVTSVGDQPPLNLAGAGEDLLAALAACLGEGVERLSQFERPGDLAATARAADVAGELLPGLLSDAPEATGPIDWVQGRCLVSEKRVLVPADWCLRRSERVADLQPRTALSTGVAAGVSFEAAAARALLELVERDAASLWWLAGQRGRPLAMEASAAREAARLLHVLRQGSEHRKSWLLDLTTDLEIPSVAAVSFNAEGRGFACGLAARLELADAVRAAVLEMCQMELALLLAMGRRERGGPGSLADKDRDQLERADKIDANRLELVHPFGAPFEHRARPRGGDLATLKQAFAQGGLEAALVDLRRDEFAIPVVHALAPELQPMPALTNTPRLLSALARTGEAVASIRGVPLL
jgi:ribosomal protein S12 methylthiotransferase accessory factor